MTSHTFINFLLFFSIVFCLLGFINPQGIDLEAYERGIRDGKSQCYPYEVSHVKAKGQGGNQ